VRVNDGGGVNSSAAGFITHAAGRTVYLKAQNEKDGHEYLEYRLDRADAAGRAGLAAAPALTLQSRRSRPENARLTPGSSTPIKI
jgi:hypothetical protein